MKLLFRKRHIALAIVALPFVYLFFPRPVVVDAVRGRIVDARTGAPIAGANIVAAWQLSTGTFGGQSDAGYLQIRETTSGADGFYRIDGWIRFYVPLFRWVNNTASPEIYVFREGFRPTSVMNVAWPQDGPGDLTYHTLFFYRSYWNGRKIELDPILVSDRQATTDELQRFRHEIKSLVQRPPTCRWHRVQSMLLALDASAYRQLDLSDVISSAKRCQQAAAFEERLRATAEKPTGLNDLRQPPAIQLSRPSPTNREPPILSHPRLGRPTSRRI